jgi:amino acid transporter
MTHGSDERLPRELTAFGLWLIAINGMIGAGIFGLPAEAARLAGAWSPWTFLICAALMLPIVLCYGALARRFSATGGPVLYASAAFGPLVGFQAGWMFYIARLTAFSANASLLVATVGHFWPQATDPVPRTLLLALVIGAFTFANAIGTRRAVNTLGALTLLKFLPLVGLVGVGIALAPGATLEALLGGGNPAAPVAGAVAVAVDGSGAGGMPLELGAAIVLVFYAFVGFESGVVPAGEAKDPKRDLPRALLWALGVASLLYALLQAVCVATLPQLATTERPMVALGGALIGEVGAAIVVLGVIASVGGNLAGSMLSTPRITYALARDGSLPAWFGAVHARYETPARSILFYGLVGFLLAAAGSFVYLAVLSVLTRLLLYALCCGALPRLGGSAPLAAVALAVCAYLLWQVQAGAWLATAAFVAVGSLLYALARHVGRSDGTPR